MSTFGIWVISALVGSLILFGGRSKGCCGGRRVGRTIAILAVVGGIALVSSRWHRFDHHSFDRHDPWASIETVVDDGWSNVEETIESHGHLPTWMLVTLVTAILISGVMLARRERIRPGTIRVFTALGVAASCFALFSFFGSPPRYYVNRDRAVKNHDRVVRTISSKSDLSRSNASRSDDRDDESRTTTKPEKRKRPQRAKRPSPRPSHVASAESSEDLSPRAGEIPVGEELAKTSPPAEKAAQPAAAAEATTAPESSAPAAPVSAPPAASEPPAAVPTPEPPAAPPAPEPTSAALGDATPAGPPAPPATPEATPAPEVKVAAKPTEPKPAQTKPGEDKPGVIEQPSATSSDGRPAWVETPGKLVGEVYSVSVKSGLYVDVPECQRALEEAIEQEANKYIEDYIGPGASQLVNVSPAWLRTHVKKKEFAEVRTSDSVGPMHQLHALLEFDDDARAEFQNRWRQSVITSRLWFVGSAATLVLALLATFYGYLRLDLRTGGQQKGRLQLAAALVALVVAAGALAVRWAVPF